MIPEDAYSAWDCKASGHQHESEWDAKFAIYKAAHPELAAEFLRRMHGELPSGWAQAAVDAAVAAHTKAETVASRKASQIALEAFTKTLPELLGGSADLTGSNLTNTSSTAPLRMNADGSANGGRHINYGVREFGMAAIMNGIALHGGFIPYGGTFLTFSDYSRNAIRMAALMKLRVIHVFTHDSIGLGEDGPTHQSIEHAASLRLIPGLDVWRPGDTAETAVAWACAIQSRTRPSALLLSRQNLAYAPKASLGEISQGAYVLAEPSEVGLHKKAQAVIIATGSEVQLALHAQAQLAQAGIAVRVVSMPSTSVFDRQSLGLQAPGAAGEPATHRGRDGRDRRLVEIRLRRGDRHRHLWRIGPRTAAVQTFRFHGGQCRCHRSPGSQALTQSVLFMGCRGAPGFINPRKTQ